MAYPGMGLCISQEDLDMVLYGYAKGKNGEQCHGHALSGLKIGDISHGKITYMSSVLTSEEIKVKT